MNARHRALTIIGLTAIAAASTAQADVFNKKTKLSFSQPVRVPGAMLAPGTYIFKLVDSQSSRHIVQVANVRENKVYATILAIPDYRLSPSSQTIITFGETGAGCATAVKAWFYPGDNSGNRFVYGKDEAAEMAKSCQQSVPHVPQQVAKAAVAAPQVMESNSTHPAVVALVQAPIKTTAPDAKETEYAQATFAKADAADTSGISGEVPAAPAATKMPKSGSMLPLVSLFGAMLVGAGCLGRALANRVS